jgi:hypothetical protein
MGQLLDLMDAFPDAKMVGGSSEVQIEVKVRSLSSCIRPSFLIEPHAYAWKVQSEVVSHQYLRFRYPGTILLLTPYTF